MQRKPQNPAHLHLIKYQRSWGEMILAGAGAGKNGSIVIILNFHNKNFYGFKDLS
jgi:hypothetical protein